MLNKLELILDMVSYYVTYFWLQLNVFASNYIDLITLWLTGVATIITVRTWWRSRGHDLKVNYAIQRSVWNETRVSELYIYNNKNRPEVITQIDVLFGGNVSLELKKFYQEPLIILPLSMAKVSLNEVSLYAINNVIINMDKIFENKKCKPVFSFTTPEKIIKAKTLSVMPYDNYIKSSLTKLGFYYIYSRVYKLKDMVYSHRIKYVGNILTEDDKDFSFHIFRNNHLSFVYGPSFGLKINQEIFDNKEKIKDFIVNKMCEKDFTVKSIKLEEFEIDKFYKDFEAKNIVVIPQRFYFFFEKYLQFMKWLNTKNKT